MAFASVDAVQNSAFAAASGTITYPTPIATDDLLLFNFAIDDNATVDDWGGSDFDGQELVNSGQAGVSGTSAWHKAVGDEDATTFTLGITGGAQKTVGQLHTISGWETSLPPEISSNTTGNDTSPDAAIVTASWGSDDNLFVWVCQMDDDPFTSYPATPTNYADNQRLAKAAAGGGTCTIAFATANVAAASDDPGVGVMGSNQWMANTIVIAPTGAGAGDVLMAQVMM